MAQEQTNVTTRPIEQLKRAIDRGGSVLYNRKLLRTHADIDRAFETEESLDTQIAELAQRKAAKAGGAKSGPAAKPARQADPDVLPEEFPGRAALEAAGLTTRSAVGSMSDEQLLATKGIGAKTLADIREALDSANQ